MLYDLSVLPNVFDLSLLVPVLDSVVWLRMVGIKVGTIMLLLGGVRFFLTSRLSVSGRMSLRR